MEGEKRILSATILGLILWGVAYNLAGWWLQIVSK